MGEAGTAARAAGSPVGKHWSASCRVHLSLLNPSHPHSVSWSPGVWRSGTLLSLRFSVSSELPAAPLAFLQDISAPSAATGRLQTLSVGSWPASLSPACFVWGFECVEMGLPTERRLTGGQREPAISSWRCRAVGQRSLRVIGPGGAALPGGAACLLPTFRGPRYDPECAGALEGKAGCSCAIRGGA